MLKTKHVWTFRKMDGCKNAPAMQMQKFSNSINRNPQETFLNRWVVWLLKQTVCKHTLDKTRKNNALIQTSLRRVSIDSQVAIKSLGLIHRTLLVRAPFARSQDVGKRLLSQGWHIYIVYTKDILLHYSYTRALCKYNTIRDYYRSIIRPLWILEWSAIITQFATDNVKSNPSEEHKRKTLQGEQVHNFKSNKYTFVYVSIYGDRTTWRAKCTGVKCVCTMHWILRFEAESRERNKIRQRNGWKFKCSGNSKKIGGNR